MTRRVIVITYRWIMVGLVVAAIVTQLVHTVRANPPGSAVNFFSFFTIESNLIAAAVFALGALPSWQPRSRWYEAARGASTTYMAVTGVVYVTLLSNLPASVDSTIPWVNEVLHYLMPLVVFLDWLFVPPRREVKARSALAWAAFPLGYAAYTLIRGAIVHWYPYPFLNVDMHGYGRVLINCIGIGIGSLVFIAAIAWLGNAMRPGRSDRPADQPGAGSDPAVEPGTAEPVPPDRQPGGANPSSAPSGGPAVLPLNKAMSPEPPVEASGARPPAPAGLNDPTAKLPVVSPRDASEHASNDPSRDTRPVTPPPPAGPPQAPVPPQAGLTPHAAMHPPVSIRPTAMPPGSTLPPNPAQHRRNA